MPARIRNSKVDKIKNKLEVDKYSNFKTKKLKLPNVKNFQQYFKKFIIQNY